MSNLKGIPIVVSGTKIAKPNGIRAIKNGLKVDRRAAAIPRGDKPSWLRVRIPMGEGYQRVKQIVRDHRLATVCEESMCPNIAECWGNGTATLMLMGDVCTRACRFCAVDTGNPRGQLNPDEPRLAAETVQLMDLKYVVLTSVDRDDLPDGGASHYADCVRRIKQRNPKTAIEILTPDFKGVPEHIALVASTDIDVFAQNVETVKRLTHPVRDPRASYEITLSILAYVKRHYPKVLTKTSLMLGLGETDTEILETMDELRAAGVDIVTFGQYLRPTVNHLPVQRYVTPAEFEQYRRLGLSKGFLEVVSGPLVRSSYRAERVLEQANCGLNKSNVT
ncbi:MAG: lipoyl synthase [Nitrococcus mobilis]|nr:lipoyl synthase [Nitrococcus mobilis]